MEPLNKGRKGAAEEEQAARAGKRGVCYFVGEPFLPRFPYKVHSDCFLAAAPAEHVQKLLCMPVRDLLAHSSESSQRKDRCSIPRTPSQSLAFNYSHTPFI